jgi:hypothetical protein
MDRISPVASQSRDLPPLSLAERCLTRSAPILALRRVLRTLPILALTGLFFLPGFLNLLLSPRGCAQTEGTKELVSKSWTLPLWVLRAGSGSPPNSTLNPPPSPYPPLPKVKNGNGADLDCKELFSSVGVQFEVPGSHAFYTPKSQTLTVTNTGEQIHLVDQFVEQWNDQAKQAALLKTVRELGPEEKKRLAENLKQWSSLTADQKQALRHREGLIAKQANEEAASVEKELPEDRREAFRKHYLESRKELEAQLRSEFDQRRKSALKELLEKVKREYANPPAEGGNK